MLKTVRCWQPWARLLVIGVVVMILGLTGCGERSPDTVASPPKMTEVAPPQVIQGLSAMVAETSPTVEVLAPLPDTVLNQDEVSVQFQVEGMSLFQDETFGLGPHLSVLVDNQFYQSVYDLSNPLILRDLAPGTHTIRAIAALPWGESFKNPSAQAQTTFHIFAKTPAVIPATALPVLTYHQPTGHYGAEPILLDYVLKPGTVTTAGTNSTAITPETATWKIRATVNGESFCFDLLEPIYLKGFKVGKNWVQLELLDAAGNPVDSVFNNTVRVIDYQPGGEDTLSQLMQDQVTVDDIASIVDPYYQPIVDDIVTVEPDEGFDEADVGTSEIDSTAESSNELDLDESAIDEIAPDILILDVAEPSTFAEPAELDAVGSDPAVESDPIEVDQLDDDATEQDVVESDSPSEPQIGDIAGQEALDPLEESI